jgi:hypothetical protein
VNALIEKQAAVSALLMSEHPSLANSPVQRRESTQRSGHSSIHVGGRDMSRTFGVRVDQWFDYSCSNPRVVSRRLNDTVWSKHKTSTLEQAFSLEAAVSAGQIMLRHTEERGGEVIPE